MRKQSTFVLSLCSVLFMASCQDEQKEADAGFHEGRLHLSASKPKAGQELRLQYEKADDTSEIPEATVDYMINKSSYPEDIELKDSADYWVGRISIPDSAMAMAFNFRKDLKYENNDKKGYVVPIFSEEGEKLAGSEAAMGAYYLNKGWRYDLDVEQDSALAMIGGTLRAHPDLKQEYDDFYPYLLIRSKENEATAYIDQRLGEYNSKQTLSNKEYTRLYSLYSVKKDKKRADSIQAVASEKFPKGELAESSFFMNYRETKSPEERQKLFDEYREKYGEDGRFFTELTYYMVRDLAATRDYEEIIALSQKMKMSQIAAPLNQVAWELAEKGEQLEQAEKLSAKSIEIQKQALTSGEKPDYLSKKQFENNISSGLASFYDTYGLINYKLGKLDQAIAAQEKAITKQSSAEANTRYMQFLSEAGRYETILEKAPDFIKNNRGSEEMKIYLEKAYAETNNSSQSFTDYMASLEALAYVNLKEDLQEEMINEPAPAFTMKDLQGNDISLASLQGKTIILDFWATWCGPCKNSFPGMKKAVEQYNGKENVQFYFVDTFENGPTREKDVTEFISQNDYPFHVLIDEAKESRGYKTADDYGIQGIPTKVIIGPKGNIRFRMVGYDGNNSKMVKELGIIIDILDQKTTAVAVAK